MFCWSSYDFAPSNFCHVIHDFEHMLDIVSAGVVNLERISASFPQKKALVRLEVGEKVVEGEEGFCAAFVMGLPFGECHIIEHLCTTY